MTIRKATAKDDSKELVIDLRGAQGNAFYLLGTANKLAKQLGMSKEESQKIQTEMQSGDYENLLSVFDKNFGDLVTLIR